MILKVGVGGGGSDDLEILIKLLVRVHILPTPISQMCWDRKGLDNGHQLYPKHWDAWN